MCIHAIIQIAPLGTDPQCHTWEIPFMGFHRHYGDPANVPIQHDLPKRKTPFFLVQHPEILTFIQTKQTGQVAQGEFWILGILGYEEKIKRRPAVNQQSALAIKHHTPNARYGLDPDAVVL